MAFGSNAHTHKAESISKYRCGPPAFSIYTNVLLIKYDFGDCSRALLKLVAGTRVDESSARRMNGLHSTNSLIKSAIATVHRPDDDIRIEPKTEQLSTSEWFASRAFSPDKHMNFAGFATSTHTHTHPLDSCTHIVIQLFVWHGGASGLKHRTFRRNKICFEATCRAENSKNEYIIFK